MLTIKACVFGLLMTLPIRIAAQDLTTSEEVQRPLRGKHRIEFMAGVLSEVSTSTTVTAGDVTTTSNSDGLIWSIAYTYHLEEDFGVNVSMGVLDVEATTSAGSSGASVETGSVIPLLLGVKYQPWKFAVRDVVRPYLSASVGAYVGSASNVRAGTTTGVESYTETAPGFRLAIGADLLLGRYFTLGVVAGYHLVSDFDKPVGSMENYSSPEVSLALGVAFGG